jgi:hypothetical protein
MTFFLQANRDALAKGWAILLHIRCVILVGLAQLVLLEETHCCKTLSCLRTLWICTEKAENCSLTAWHSEGSIRIQRLDARISMNGKCRMKNLK